MLAGAREMDVNQCFHKCGNQIAVPQSEEETMEIAALLPEHKRAWLGLLRDNGLDQSWNVYAGVYNGWTNWGEGEGSTGEARAAMIFDTAAGGEGKWCDPSFPDSPSLHMRSLESSFLCISPSTAHTRPLRPALPCRSSSRSGMGTLPAVISRSHLLWLRPVGLQV